ncbi:hypothetical protein CcCBS67573_g05662 [Chytriomyces confervae]|uniref:Uncharacterized protein n=1 Tax=Chytriomyces confervae TaxID=246404 RepID=A0A507F9V9_9FUNG|nr:hypothetical protein CcCBS67573_g05662 [Chytriomyces confervae]
MPLLDLLSNNRATVYRAIFPKGDTRLESHEADMIRSMIGASTDYESAFKCLQILVTILKETSSAANDVFSTRSERKRSLEAVIGFFIQWLGPASASHDEPVFLMVIEALKTLGFSGRSIPEDRIPHFLSTLQYHCLHLSEPSLLLALDLLFHCCKSKTVAAKYLELFSLKLPLELLSNTSNRGPGISDESACLIVAMLQTCFLDFDHGRKEFLKSGGAKVVASLLSQKRTRQMILALLDLLQLAPETASASVLSAFLDKYHGIQAFMSLLRYRDASVLARVVDILEAANEENYFKGDKLRSDAIQFLKSVTLSTDAFHPTEEMELLIPRCSQLISTLQSISAPASASASKTSKARVATASESQKESTGLGQVLLRMQAAQRKDSVRIPIPKVEKDKAGLGPHLTASVDAPMTRHPSIKIELNDDDMCEESLEPTQSEFSNIQITASDAIPEPAPVSDTETLTPLIKMLTSFDPLMRAQGAVVARKLTTRQTPVSENDALCEMLAEALLPVFEDDEAHVQINCCIALGGLAMHSQHRRELLVSKGVLESLLGKLHDYDVVLLEHCLKVLRLFAENDNHCKCMLALNGIRLFRMLLFSNQTSIQQNARFCYDRIVKVGGKNAQIEANMILNADPWESVMRKWKDS